MMDFTEHHQHQPPRTKIIVQPARFGVRFRYKSEKSFGGPIPGVSSSPASKTYPSIKLEGCRGRARVFVSCVTAEEPYLAHPHSLVGDNCQRGVCSVDITPESPTVEFPNLGIQCVKKRDIESSLQERRSIRVDPFKHGFSHSKDDIELNIIRLCFQVLLEDPEKPGEFTKPIAPVVSEPLYDKKAFPDLSIAKLSDCVSYVDGGRKDIIILCEKIVKDDIEVWFYEKQNDKLVWSAKADIQVYKQHAIWLRTPKYKTDDVNEPVNVFIKLRRPSDRATCKPVPFQLLPSGKRKKPFKIENRNRLMEQLQGYNKTGISQWQDMAPQWDLHLLKEASNFSPKKSNISPKKQSRTNSFDIEGDLINSNFIEPNLLADTDTSQQGFNIFEGRRNSSLNRSNVTNILDVTTETVNSPEAKYLLPTSPPLTNSRDPPLNFGNIATTQQNLSTSGRFSNSSQKQYNVTNNFDLNTETLNSDELTHLIRNNITEYSLPDLGKCHQDLNISGEVSSARKQPADTNLIYIPMHSELNSFKNNAGVGTSQRPVDIPVGASMQSQIRHNVPNLLDLDKFNNLNNNIKGPLRDLGAAQQHANIHFPGASNSHQGNISTLSQTSHNARLNLLHLEKFNNVSSNMPGPSLHPGTAHQIQNMFSSGASNSSQGQRNLIRAAYQSMFIDDDYYEDPELPLSNLSNLSLSDEIPCCT